MIILILGIILSVAIIAGGTYAWLTFSTNVQNATKNFTTRHFTFTTTTGTTVANLYPFPHQPIRAGITSGNGYIELDVTKGTNSSDSYVPKASSFKIMVKFDTMQVNVADYIKVAVCRSATVTDCDNSVATAIPSTVNNSNWVVVNKSIANNTSEQVIFEDTSSTSSPFTVDGYVARNYYVYFWLNSEVVTNENAATLAASQVKGSVYIVATQGT